MQAGPNLTKYVEEQNQIHVLMKEYAGRIMFGAPSFDVLDPANLSETDLKGLAERLGTDLSPEVLTCDGERPRREVVKRSKFLNGVVAELEALGISVSRY